jgi:hypothetical protein
MAPQNIVQDEEAENNALKPIRPLQLSSGMIKNAPLANHDKDSLQKDEQDKPSPPGLLTIPKRRMRGRCLKTAKP